MNLVFTSSVWVSMISEPSLHHALTKQLRRKEKRTCCLRIIPIWPLPPCLWRALILFRSLSLIDLFLSTRSCNCWLYLSTAASSVVSTRRACSFWIWPTLSLYCAMDSWMDWI